VRPYYEADGITIYHGDCRTLFDVLDAAVMLTDPPYGRSYRSNQRRTAALARSIANDADTSVRDVVLAWWAPRPALVFGSWRASRPEDARTRLIWDNKGALGMGDLSLPWKPADQEIYVLGTGFHGPRTSNVLRFVPVQSTARNGRTHPHEKPVALLSALLRKCPAGSVLDPFMGSGTTLVAAKNLGRRAIGIELEEKYCEIAAKRLSQQVLDFNGAA
jgi:site-specific DNA-methyltransferase (adenine-specific)